MANIFFGCSMRGGYPAVSAEELVQFPHIIESLGHRLMSRHQTQVGIIDRENKLTKTAIHDRDYEWLMDADVGVFEISNPSLGVGGEIADMIHLGKPVICLLKRGLEESISAYIQGKQDSKHITTKFECRSYGTLNEAEKEIKEFVESCQF